MAPKTNSKVKLIETAIDLVRKSSYSDVGVNEICETAGVTKGAFYHHFKSKAALYAEAASYKKDSEEKMLNALLSDKHTALQKLKNLIGYVYYKGFQNTETDLRQVSGCPFFTAGAINSQQDDIIRQASTEYVENEIGYWKSVIDELVQSGHMSAPQDIGSLARMVYEYVNGVLTFSRISNDEVAMKHDLEKGVYRLFNIPEQVA